MRWNQHLASDASLLGRDRLCPDRLPNRHQNRHHGNPSSSRPQDDPAWMHARHASSRQPGPGSQGCATLHGFESPTVGSRTGAVLRRLPLAVSAVSSFVPV
jgi:hypothetical protein